MNQRRVRVNQRQVRVWHLRAFVGGRIRRKSRITQITKIFASEDLPYFASGSSGNLNLLSLGRGGRSRLHCVYDL